MDLVNGGPKTTSKEALSIEKTYQKKSQLEHILLRPDTYIGSVEKAQELMWIFDTEKECMIQKQIEYVPGLYKIFDEILVNAADNKQRDTTMDCIKIDINVDTNTISVWNNGEGIPVAMHKDEKMYVPTMIFGHLLTSSNYNDEEEKVTGGRNGYGAKLCNIFSTKFIVETASKQYRHQFKQTWGANMTKTSEPKIKEFIGEDFTKVTFCPDLSKFKMEKLDDDIVALMSRRAYDVAASTRGVKVYLNGKRLQVKNFKDYIDLYIKNKEDDTGAPLKVVYEVANNRWEVALTISDRGFQQVSFVNSIATTKGGRHVDYITDMIVKQLIEVLKKKNKGGVTIKPFQVKTHMWLFVNCLIVNPTFDSQTKENMTLQVKNFGSKCQLSEKFITSVSKCGIVENVLSWAKFKAQNELSKQSGKKQSKLKGIPKLEDANDAGTKNAHKCTLILTEGDSAKTVAVSGLGVVGRDHYGVFPLRGKLLNVREATHKQILENAEINNLIKIVGLQYKKKYLSNDDLKTLRYGKVMIMTDQDQDGSHIKGLIINFIHHNWPDLLQLNFLEEFITPIVKATRKEEVYSFYSLPEFDEWKQNTHNYTKFQIKYYKGLGTSSSKEAKEYFQNMERHRIRFKYGGPEDDKNVLMAFSKKTVEHRKDWLLHHMADCKQRKALGLPERYLYTKNTRSISYTDFINSELVLYSNSDNIRSIPSLVDGLKPGQRKVLFTCIKRNDKREVKVAQLAGSVAEHSAYHHGENSLCATIVNLAQNYVGSNNVNLLEPRGQFGSRLCGGKDSASPRYIFTLMSPVTRLIFHPHDDALLTHEVDDNQKIEPKWYIPILPMVLVNGADGIGTGWMTKIPNYNPREIVENLRRMLKGDEIKHMIPWYKNFKGTIVECADDRYAVNGEISVIGPDKIEITELPVGVWTQTYKENVLEVMLHGSEKTKAMISDYKEYNTDTTVKFVVTTLPGQLTNMEQEGLHKAFKLQTSIATTSMVLFDEMACLRKYESVSVILQEFYDLRLRMYIKRKEYLEGSLQAQADRLTFQAKFIVEKCNGTLQVENKKRKDIIQELIKRGYPSDPVKEWSMRMSKDPDEEEAAENIGEEDDEDSPSQKEKKVEDPEKAFKNMQEVKKFDYLLGMSMWMLTNEKKNELLKQRDNKVMELEILRNKAPADLWKEDLDTFMEKLDVLEEQERKDEANVPTKKGAKTSKKKVDIAETMPSPMGRRVEPSCDEMKKKFTKAKESKERKIKKEKGSTTDLTEEKDEFDVLIENNKKSLKDKLGNSPELIAKKTIRIKKEKKPVVKKKNNKNDLGDENNSSDTEELPKRERTTRRATTKKINYSFDSDQDSESGDQELFENSLVDDHDKVPVKILTDSEDEISPVRRTETSEDLFDTLVGRKPESQPEASENDAEIIEVEPTEIKQPETKAGKSVAPPKSRKREKKKIINSDESDTDYERDPPMKKQKSTARDKKKTIAYSDESDIDLEYDVPVKKLKGKSREKKKMAMDTDDSDADFDIVSTKSKVTVARKGRNTKPVSYKFDISESE